ncbi:MAG: four helix bundle protein [Bacteroidia bacterium]
MSNVSSYKDLIVWQKAMALTKELYNISSSFPESEKFGLTQQLKRCAISIPSNIAEGWGRNSNGYFVQFLNVSKGSLCEAETQLHLAIELNFIKQDICTNAFDLSIEISKMIKALIKNIEKSPT